MDKTKKVTLTAVAAISMLAYACVGQYHRPLYYLGFFQVCFMIAVILPIDKKTFRIILSVGTLVFSIVFFSHWDQFVIQSQSPVKSEMMFAILSVAVLGALANKFYSSERSFHEHALDRFTQIGIHSARIVHDLKGLIGAPHLHIQYLRTKDSLSFDFNETQEILQLVARDLDFLKNTLAELNVMSAPAGLNQEWLCLSEVINSAEVLLSKQTHGVKILRSGDASVRADRAAFTSILVNLLLNSIQNFNETRTLEPVINIVVESGKISILDNGGGFKPEVLKSFASGHYYSTRVGGSGLGLMLISESIQKLGGKVLADNVNGGAKVELKFSGGRLKLKG